jgi:hypothetical protein
MLQTKVVENIKTHILCLVNNFLFSKIVVFMRKRGRNIVERGKPQMTIWRMRIACWIPKATNTHSGCVTLIAFPLQQRLHEGASMLRLYVYCLSCYNFVFMFLQFVLTLGINCQHLSLNNRKNLFNILISHVKLNQPASHRRNWCLIPDRPLDIFGGQSRSHFSYIPPTLHIHSFIHYRRCKTAVIESVIKLRPLKREACVTLTGKSLYRSRYEPETPLQ